MVPTAPRLRLAVMALAFVCALALAGIIQQGPRGGHAGIAPAGILNQWPRKYLDGAVLTGVIVSGPRGVLGGAVPLTGVLQQGGFPR
jgi:hypothetical protein